MPLSKLKEMHMELTHPQAEPPAPDTCFLYLVRHAATANNLERPPRLQGQRSNLELSPDGRQQARRVARFLSALELSAVYSSPLVRARETALAIAGEQNKEVEILEDLTEVDVGNWEGRNWTDIQVSEQEAYEAFMTDPGSHGYAGGENLQQVSQRVLPTMDRLLQTHLGQRIAVVAHNVVNRVFLASLWDLPMAQARRITQSNGGINVIRARGRERKLVTINATFHLEPPSRRAR